MQPENAAIEKLPESIRYSKLLTHRQLLSLASVDCLPVIDPSYDNDRLRNIFQYYAIDPEEMEKELHCYASELLDAGKITDAWQVLLSSTD
jgi:hypothetical protein